MKSSFVFLFATFSLYVKYAAADTTDCDSVDLTNKTDVAAALSLTVTCGNSTIVAVLDACVLVRQGFTPDDDVSLFGPAGTSGHPPAGGATAVCGNATSDFNPMNNELTITLTDDFTTCSTDTSGSDDTNYVYENALRSFQFSNANSSTTIIRYFHFISGFTCTYPRAGTWTGVANVSPSVVSVSSTAASEAGDFASSAKLCSTSACAAGEEIVAGAGAGVNEKAYVVVESIKSLNIVILSIWATPSSNETGSPSHDFVKDKCYVDTIGTMMNNKDKKSYAELFWFVWVHDENAPIFIHVTWSLCDTNVDSCPDATCPARRRRSLVKDNTETYTATLGPFIPTSKN